jgi:hypothetical protein
MAVKSFDEFISLVSDHLSKEGNHREDGIESEERLHHNIKVDIRDLIIYCL